MFKLLFLALFAGGWALAAASLHVVRTPANFATVTVLPKNDLTFDDTYVDARAWTSQDIPKHRDLVRRLILSGKSDALAHVMDAKSKRDISTQLSDALGADPMPPAVASNSAFDAALAQIKAGKINPQDLAKMIAAAR